MSDRLAVLPQYLMPKQAMTAFGGVVASGAWGPVTTRIIRNFVARYGVNMAEAANPDITSYQSFNDFFTRALKPGAQPACKIWYANPVPVPPVPATNSATTAPIKARPELMRMPTKM